MAGPEAIGDLAVVAGALVDVLDLSAIGVPVVMPSNTPDRMRTWSGSCRWVVKRDWPGRRRSSQGWMSASDSGMRGGQPSTTQPIAGPWLSPQVVTRNRWPKLLCDIGRPAQSSVDDRDVGRGGVLHADDMVAAIDMVHLAGDAGGEVGQQVDAGAADLLDGDVAAAAAN